MNTKNTILTTVLLSTIFITSCEKKEKTDDTSQVSGIEGTWDFKSGTVKFYKNSNLQFSETFMAPLPDTADFDYPAQLIFNSSQVFIGYLDEGEVFFDDTASYVFSNNTLVLNYGSGDKDTLSTVAITGDGLLLPFREMFTTGSDSYRREADMNYSRKK